MDTLRRYVLIALACVMMLAAGLASSDALQRTVSAAVVGTPVSLGNVTVETDRQNVDEDEVLWLARVIYSETKQPHEQELVAWVVRNRVETGYRGNESYQDVVLDPWQFSAFNRNSSKRSHYSSLDKDSAEKGFQTALAIAQDVANASIDARPFDDDVRHFYSEQSMVGGRAPAWAHNRQPVDLDRDVDARRFRFYSDVS